MAELTSSADKVTENFTGKEKDDEIELKFKVNCQAGLLQDFQYPEEQLGL